MEPFTTQIRVVVQIAKSEGLKVIASAGNEAKLDFLRSLGANVVFNYKTTDLETVLHEHGPLDLYWDHVGNKTLSTVLGHMRERGRVILIGGTASYNAPPDPVTNMANEVMWKRLSIHGFLVNDYEEELDDWFYATVPQRVASGEIQYLEHAVHGLEEVPRLVLEVQRGDNIGKAVVVLADD